MTEAGEITEPGPRIRDKTGLAYINVRGGDAPKSLENRGLLRNGNVLARGMLILMTKAVEYKKKNKTLNIINALEKVRRL